MESSLLGAAPGPNSFADEEGQTNGTTPTTAMGNLANGPGEGNVSGSGSSSGAQADAQEREIKRQRF